MHAQEQDQTLLVVDDDAEWRDFAGWALSESYSLRFAGSGEDGLRIARKARPSAIILDVLMPQGMDGFSVLCELKKFDETTHIPVIMVTSVNVLTGTCFDQGVLRQYLGLAPAAFLEKPVMPDLLQETVSRVLAGRGAITQSRSLTGMTAQ